MTGGGRSWPLLLAAAALLLAAGIRIWATGEGDVPALTLTIMGAMVLGAWLVSEGRGGPPS